MKKHNAWQKVLAMTLALVMVLGMIPKTTVAVTADSSVRLADPSTMNAYQSVFLQPDTIGVELTTENAGGVWTDKSVFTADAIPAELSGATSEENTQISVADEGDNFLVALSAIASNKEIVGYSTTPTDTMFVLDLSGSMGMSSSPGSTRTGSNNRYQYTAVTHYDHTMVAAMIEAANKAIHQLLTLNNHNRVGVVLYSGNSQVAASGADTAQLLLPLGRYDAVESTSGGQTTYEYLEYALTQATNTLYEQQGNRWQNIGQKTYTTAITASVKNGLTTEGGAEVPDASKVTLGGTYIQNGLYKAWQEFEQADTVIADGSIQAGATRMPIMVLMSDGAPTTATHLYTGNNGTMGTSTAGTGQTTTAGIAFLTQLTAAWTLAKMEEHYDTTGRFYSLGLDTGSDYDTSVLDPANGNDSVKDLWETYLALGNRSMELTDLPNTNNANAYHDSTIEKDDLINEMVYVDEYFPASSAQELVNAFQSIVDEIILQSKYYPTYVENDHDHDGYITFTDKIGAYMEVTDVHGIVIGDTLFSGALLARGFEDGSIFGTVDNPSDLGDNLVWSVQERLGIDDVTVARALLQNAYEYGQLAYESDTDFSNYIGWYADASGKYLDFWHEGTTAAAPEGAAYIVRSYGMLGNTDAAHGISAEDMMYASIRVSQELNDTDNDGIPGETLVTWQIPASLVPTITYQVKAITDAAGKITGVESVELENSNVKPIRLLYEVALREDIHDWNIADLVADAYRDSTENKDAGYTFYTNQWKKENGTTDTTRNTYSHFEPSVQNEWYYYTEDAIIYTDENGTAYTGNSAPSASGTYYRSYIVYEKMENGTYRIHTHYEEISAASLAEAQKSGDNWVIPKGTVFRFWDPFQYEKSANTTGTHTHSEYPMVVHDDNNDNYYAYDVLGNNGKLTVVPATGIKVTKTVDEVVDGASSTFTFQISGGSGTATLIRLNAAGEEASRQNLVFTDGVAEFTISDQETVYIIGLTDGTEYTVSEKGNDDYSVASVTVNGQLVDGTIAQITADAITSVDFVNTPKGYGDLYITKQIISDHTVPEDIMAEQFQILVDVGTELAGQELTVAMTDMDDPTQEVTTTVEVSASGSFALVLQANQTAKVLDLPEGTVVTVIENLSDEQQDYFTYTVKTRDHSGAEEEENKTATIHKDMNATATVINEYTPVPAELKLGFNGTKNFDAEKMTEDASFTFRLQQYVGGAWTDVDTASVTIPAGTKDATQGFSFDTLELTFDEAGTYSYQILEDVGSNGDVTYDRSIYTFSVIVTDDGNGKLQAKVVANAESGDEGNFSVTQGSDGWTVSTTFNNEYHTTATDIDIKKTVIDNAGSGKTGQGFIMESYEASVDADGLWTIGSFIRSATTDAEGEVRLVRNYDNSDFANDTDGDNQVTYHFIIKERNTGDTGWTYDNTHYLVTVVLTRTEGEDGTESMTADFTIHKGVAGENGTFTAGEAVAVSGNAASISFTNTFDPSDAKVDLNIVPTVTKHLEGRGLNAGEFTFTIYADGDRETPLATGTNDAQGDVDFDKALTFDKVGTYALDVVEVKGSLGGVTYDETVYDMVVIVAEQNGALVADYFFEDSTTKTVTFYNTYDAADTEIVIEGTKTLTGRPLVNAEFRFDLVEIVSETDTTAMEGGVKLTAESDPDDDKDGTTQFAFPAIPYTTTGTYYYLVTEQGAGTTSQGVTYSSAQYIVKVTVTDPGNGELSASSQIISGGDALSFTNTYVPQGTSADLSSNKTLTGRVMADGEFSFTLTEKTDSTYATDKTGGVSETVQNAANGTITFSTLHFDEVGDYYYVVEEAAGSAGGVSYDSTKYQIHISVTDNHIGKLVAKTTITQVRTVVEDGVQTEVSEQVSSIVFHNTYTVDGDGELTLNGVKVYNETLEADQFTFGLFDSEGNLIEAVKNAEDGTFTFSKLTYDETDVGNTYTYLVQEILPVVDGNELSNYQGITYDTTVYTVEVIISDDGEGGILVDHTVNGSEETAIEFENTYSITEEDTVTLGGVKTLVGDRTTVAAEEFTFGLYQGETLVESVDVKADGTFTFQALTFSAEDIGNHSYTVREILPEGGNGTNGITYDPTVYTVEVYVVDNRTGGVDASYTINGSAHNLITFENTYEAKPVSHALSAKKIYEKGLKGDDFTFKLEGTIGDEAIYQTKRNDKDGNIAFDQLTFEEAGVYQFTVTEIDQVLGFINYSKEVYTVEITVTDNKLGALEITDVSIVNSTGTDSDTIEFENVYILDDDAKVTLYGDKSLSGYRDTVRAEEFNFGLYDAENVLVEKVSNDASGRFVFKALEFDENDLGQHIYYIREILPEVDGVAKDKLNGYTYDTTEYQVVVTVTDNDKGGIIAEHTVNGFADGQISFANKYEVTPTKVKLEGTKIYEKGLEGEDFTFILEGEIDGTAVKQTKTNDANGKIYFDELPFTKEGTYTFTVKERDDLLGFIQYSKEVYTVVITVEDNLEGALEVTGISIVDSEDQTSESMIFENVYILDDDAEITLSGNKSLSGYRNTVRAEEFSFGLYDAENVLVEKVSNTASGRFEFTTLTFDENDLGQHTYYIREILPEVDGVAQDKLNGYTYDKTQYTVVVTVTDDNEGGIDAAYTVNGVAEGAISFANKYEVTPTKVKLEGTKIYEKGLEGEDFTFILEGEIDGTAVKQTKTNDANGKIYFDELPFTKEGTYTFTVKERDDLLGFIQYSKEVYTVVITVEDNLEGALEVTGISIVDSEDQTSESMIFENVYILDDDAEITLSGNKSLSGYRNTVRAEEFSFGLYDAENVLVEKVSNTASGRFEFATLTFDENDLGQHTYYIREILPEVDGVAQDKLNGYTYDKTQYTVVVTVTDDNEGGIDAAYTVNGVAEGAISFANKYEVTPTKVKLEGTKIYEKGLEGEEFTFILEGEIDGTAVKQTKTNDANGKIYFDELPFTKEGTYTFTVKERDDLLGFIEYSKTVYTVEVTVTDDKAGRLVAEITVNDKSNGEIVFENNYKLLDAENELTLKGTKSLTGRELVAGEFTFGLYDAEGNLIEAVTNDAAGNFVFSKLTYQIQENDNLQYTYTIKEAAGNDPSVTYDETVYTVQVNVMDDGKGGAALSYTVNGVAEAPIAFTNTYTPPADAKAQINILKEVVNKTEPGIGLDGFTFLLSDGNTTQSVTSDAEGKASFQFTFGAQDIGKTYEYELSEKKGSVAGVVYDTTVHKITVEVDQNADGTLKVTMNGKQTNSVSVTFKNTYTKPTTPVTGDDIPMIMVTMLLVSAAGMAMLLLTKPGKKGKYSA